MAQSTPKVKQSPPQDTAPKCKKMAEFLRDNPLPPQVRHLEPYLRRLHLDAFLSLAKASIAANLTPAEADAAIMRLAEFTAQDKHRCAGCLYWVDSDSLHVLGSIVARETSFFAVCERCHDKIVAGNASAQMLRNMRGYVGVTE